LNFGPSPNFDPAAAHLPSPPAGPPASQPSGLWWAHPAFPSPPSLTCRPCPHLPPSIKPAKRCRPPCPNCASPGRRPSPAPWQEADPSRPLPLPLLYWPHPPLLLSVTGTHRHQWRRLHFTIARSPPSPSAPIKGTLVVPHLAAPHTALLSSSLAPELASTTFLHRHRFAAVTRSLHRHSISGEGTPDAAMSPPSWPLSSKLGATVHGRSIVDRGRTWSTVRGPSPRLFPRKNNSRIDNSR
jgi:hypothetical protein